MFTGYFEASVNFNAENRRGKFVILISILNPIYSTLIRNPLFKFSSRIIDYFKCYNYIRQYFLKQQRLFSAIITGGKYIERMLMFFIVNMVDRTSPSYTCYGLTSQ